MQFGNNGYGKPATALNILRETVMGRNCLTMHLKCMQTVGNSNTNPEDFLELWKMHLQSI
jgi:hypothetical protein